MAQCSSSVKPEVTKSYGAPASSMVAMAPKRAPVSARALSTTSRSTVSRSRLALIRRLAAQFVRNAHRRAPAGAESVCRDRARDRQVDGPGRGDSAGRAAKYLLNSP